MRKLNIPKNIMKTKWAVLLFVTLILIILGRAIPSPALTQTAVVLGLGIDYNSESGFKISAQSAIPSGSAASGGNTQTSYLTYVADGRTVAEAVNRIAQNMGLNISLAHCNVVYLSESVLNLSVIQVLEPLTGVYSLPEQAMLVTGELPPEKLLAVRVGTTISAPFYLQSTLIKHEGSDGIVRTTIKDFMAKAASRSASNVLPYITVKQVDDPSLDDQGSEENNKQYIMKKALVLNLDSYMILEDAVSEILAIYNGEEVLGQINYTMENGACVEFKIMDTKLKFKAEKKSVSADMTLSVAFLDIQFSPETEKVVSTDEIVQQASLKLKNQIEERLNELLQISKQSGIDFLNLETTLYQSVGRKLEQNCLQAISFTPAVKIQVKETA